MSGSELARTGHVIDAEFIDEPAGAKPIEFPEPPAGFVYIAFQGSVFLGRCSSLDIKSDEALLDYRDGSNAARNVREATVRYQIRLNVVAKKVKSP